MTDENFRLALRRFLKSETETMEKKGSRTNLRPWQPGQSGNPAGRRRKRNLLKNIAQDELNRKLSQGERDTYKKIFPDGIPDDFTEMQLHIRLCLIRARKMDSVGIRALELVNKIGGTMAEPAENPTAPGILSGARS